jgi:hypothetical protein
MTQAADPAQIKADQLPHGIKAKAARHDGIAFKVTLEKPQIWANIHFSNDFTFAKRATFFADVFDAIKHQHRWKWKLRIACAKHFATATLEEFFKGKS